MEFCEGSTLVQGFVWALIFAHIRSSLSLEIQSASSGVMAHKGILLLLYQSIKLLNFIADGKKSEPSLIFFLSHIGIESMRLI